MNTCRAPHLEVSLRHFTMSAIALFSASEQTHCVLVVYDCKCGHASELLALVHIKTTDVCHKQLCLRVQLFVDHWEQYGMIRSSVPDFSKFIVLLPKDFV